MTDVIERPCVRNLKVTKERERSVTGAAHDETLLRRAGDALARSELEQIHVARRFDELKLHRLRRIHF